MATGKRSYLRDDDYAVVGAYLVTVCAWERRCLFGEGGEDGIHLSSLGRIVEDVLEEMSAYHPGVALDAYAVMPNHVHAIVMLDGRGRQPPPLPAVVGAFKGRAARRAGQPLWQRGYQGRVVRGERDLAALREYVLANPLRWWVDGDSPHRRGRVRRGGSDDRPG